jgi:aspartate-semialdehyde dehydrogenase
MLRVLEEHNAPVGQLRLLASARSAGTTIRAMGLEHIVEELTPESFSGMDYALFSAGGTVSKTYAPIAAKAGCVAIDNSSVWRMDPEVPLVVPEVNPEDVCLHKGIIANPNCSTIQLVVALKPLAEAYGIRRLVVSTYQSPSGAGQQGVDQLTSELAGQEPVVRITQHDLAMNAVFHAISELNGSSEEEIKMMRETRRILHDHELPIAVTCVRVPVLGGHAESIAVETVRPCDSDEARELLASKPGIVVADDPASGVYPMPSASLGTDPVYIGRIRRDPSVEHGLLLWVVADNLRKGAATNAVQILELLTNTSKTT